MQRDRGGESIYNESSERVDTVDDLRVHYARRIVDVAGTSDAQLKELYGADDAGIEKFRTYYVKEFCAAPPPSAPR